MKKIAGAAEVLTSMAATFRERNAKYKNNYKMVGPVMVALHPEGLKMETVADHELYHLYNLLIVKLTRFAISGLKHEDSIRDIGVYAAMIDAILLERQNGHDRTNGTQD